MGNIITSLYTGASGIYTNQTGIQVTGNNIANVNTEGYSRQTASITSAGVLEQGSLIYGTGSSVDTIDRAESIFITKQLVAQSEVYGEYEAASTPLSDIEEVLGIDESSLSSEIDAFFDAWEELSNNPDGATERQAVLQQAENLADAFNETSQLLSNVTDSINISLESAIPTLNENLQQIAELNYSIMQAEVSGEDANTLEDQRDLLVQQVSETCGATIYEDENGMVCMQLEGGQPLVTGNTCSSFTTEYIDGKIQVSLENGNYSSAITMDNCGGQLKGLLTVRDETLPEFEDAIDRLAYEVASDINAVHSTGTDQNGDPAGDLFSMSVTGTPTAWAGAAASISVAFNDTALVATGTTGTRGDNSLCQDIIQLRDTETVDGCTFTEEYARIAAKIGLLVNSNEQKLSDSEELLSEIQEDWDSVAGVSTDEEMLMLIQFQAGYEAAANYLSVVQEMLDTLLSLSR